MQTKKDDIPPPLSYEQDPMWERRQEWHRHENTGTVEELPLADSESRTCKVVDTNDVAAKVYWFSCLLPEATQFKVNEMPVIQKEKGTLRLLVIAGNLTHFAGDMDTILIEHWKKAWDHILFVPGPYDYGRGTLCAGDDYCIRLQHLMGQEKFTVFVPGLTDSVLFSGPGLRFIGAPCWPTDPEIYKEARVYESTRGPGREPLSGSALVKAQVDVIDKKQYVGKSAAEKRLRQDVAVLIVALREVEKKREQETRIVVTYGCPDEQLSTSVKHNDPFRGAVTLGSPPVYTYLAQQVDYWIHGAKGDDFRSSISTVIGADRIITLNNVYTAINHLNGDGFGVNFADAIKIERRK